MTLNEAIAHAESVKANNVCSTSGKALVLLLDALKKSRNEAFKEAADIFFGFEYDENLGFDPNFIGEVIISLQSDEIQ